MRKEVLLVLLFLGLILSGCALDEYYLKTTQETRQNYVNSHPKRPQEIKDCILKNEEKIYKILINSIRAQTAVSNSCPMKTPQKRIALNSPRNC